MSLTRMFQTQKNSQEIIWCHPSSSINVPLISANYVHMCTMSGALDLFKSSILVVNQIFNMIWKLEWERNLSCVIVAETSQLFMLTPWVVEAAVWRTSRPLLLWAPYSIILRRLETINLGRGAERAPVLSLIEMLKVFSSCKVAAVLPVLH